MTINFIHCYVQMIYTKPQTVYTLLNHKTYNRQHYSKKQELHGSHNSVTVAWLLPVAIEVSEARSCHRLEWWIKFWELMNVVCLIFFFSGASFTGNRHTGHVDCFLSQTSMQERWKMWPHSGIILSSSFSWYSPKHIEHLQDTTVQSIIGKTNINANNYWTIFGG